MSPRPLNVIDVVLKRMAATGGPFEKSFDGAHGPEFMEVLSLFFVPDLPGWYHSPCPAPYTLPLAPYAVPLSA